MARRSVVLGLPISLALRGLSAAGGTLGGLAAKAGGTAAALTVAAPWVAGMLNSTASVSTPGIPSFPDSIGGMITAGLGMLTFADLNAEVVTVNEKRRMAIVSIPGREADFIQDLGGHSTKYRISGKFFDYDPGYAKNQAITQQIMQTFIGNGATGSTQMLRLIMRTGTTMPFMCEHDIAMVVITDFKFSMLAGKPRWVQYEMELVEKTRIPYIFKMALLGVSNNLEKLAPTMTSVADKLQSFGSL